MRDIGSSARAAAWRQASRWQASASTDVHAAVSAVAGHDGRAVRLDYDFDGKAGYAVLSRPLPFDLPDNYEISFWVRGAGPANTFEVKLTDASAENVSVAKGLGARHWAAAAVTRRTRL
jgi:hypothetical protein